MGFFDSSNETTNYTENNNTQLANYGNGLTFAAGGDSVVNIDYLADDVAIKAFDSADNFALEIGLWAEQTAEMNQTMHANNLQFADNTIRDTFLFSAAQTANTLGFADNAMLNTMQFADNAIGSAQAGAAMTSRNAMQFADNTIRDNYVFTNETVNSSMSMIDDVMRATAAQTKELTGSVFDLAETVQSGQSTQSRNINKYMSFFAVGILGWVLIK